MILLARLARALVAIAMLAQTPPAEAAGTCVPTKAPATHPESSPGRAAG